jgi:N utilization substance protein B
MAALPPGKISTMSKAQFTQRKDGRAAAMQYLYAWSLNAPKNLAEDLRVFFENMEQPRDTTPSARS